MRAGRGSCATGRRSERSDGARSSCDRRGRWEILPWTLEKEDDGCCGVSCDRLARSQSERRSTLQVMHHHSKPLAERQRSQPRRNPARGHVSKARVRCLDHDTLKKSERSRDRRWRAGQKRGGEIADGRILSRNPFGVLHLVPKCMQHLRVNFLDRLAHGCLLSQVRMQQLVLPLPNRCVEAEIRARALASLATSRADATNILGGPTIGRGKTDVVAMASSGDGACRARLYRAVAGRVVRAARYVHHVGNHASQHHVGDHAS